jgi:hypothetical protein
VSLLSGRRSELAFAVGRRCVFASAIVSAMLYAFLLFLASTGRETLESIAGSIVWKAVAHIAGWSALMGLVLVLFGRGYKRVLLALLALFLSWLFVFPYGIEVR